MKRKRVTGGLDRAEAFGDSWYRTGGWGQLENSGLVNKPGTRGCLGLGIRNGGSGG